MKVNFPLDPILTLAKSSEKSDCDLMVAGNVSPGYNEVANLSPRPSRYKQFYFK